MSAPTITTTPTLTPSRDTQRHDDRPFKVIVKNDSHNSFDGVAFALARVLPGVSVHRGLEHAITIHKTGAAIVWSGHREIAELYHEQLTSLGLTMAPLER